MPFRSAGVTRNHHFSSQKPGMPAIRRIEQNAIKKSLHQKLRSARAMRPTDKRWVASPSTEYAERIYSVARAQDGGIGVVMKEMKQGLRPSDFWAPSFSACRRPRRLIHCSIKSGPI